MKKRTVAVLMVVAILACILSACGTSTKKYTVTFDCQDGTTPQKQKVSADFVLPVPQREGYLFMGWYTDRACTESNKWSGENITGNITVYAKWVPHTHDFGDNYFMLVECADENCNAVGRNKDDGSAKQKRVYDYSAEKQHQIDGHYNTVLDLLQHPGTYSQFEQAFDEYEKDVEYIVTQYRYAYVLYCTYKDASSTQRYDTISEVQNNVISNYYPLYRQIYNSSYAGAFYSNWPTEEIEEALFLADSYGNSLCLQLKDQIDKLILEYDSVVNTASESQISALYAQLVNLNTQLAQVFGYGNYMEYAYAKEHSRCYTPATATQIRNYIKQYIAPLLNNVLLKSQSLNLQGESARLYEDLMSKSIFGSDSSAQRACNLLGNYFKEMTFDGKNKLDFYQIANNVFQTGNYYLGKQTGAFTYWVGTEKDSMLYFSNEQSIDGSVPYQHSFTFVHEFGHYANYSYNKGLSISTDHAETQSQGNEMMFLAWLKNNLDSSLQSGYSAIETEQLADMLCTICIAAAVDEFEQAAYSGRYNNQPINTANYTALFKQILGNYSSFLSPNYWKYVVFENPGYYISYAVSALPVLQLYVAACDNFDFAKQTYFKLITFSDSTQMVFENRLRVNYFDVLHYCGLNDPTQTKLYTDIYNYISKM